MNSTRIRRVNNSVKLLVRNNFWDDYIVWETWQKQQYALVKTLSRPKFILDLGAYIGDFSLYAAYYFPESKIYAFEPSVDNYQLLKTNLTLNNFPNIHIFPWAITGNYNGPGKLGVDNYNKGSHSLLRPSPTNLTVDCVSLSSLMKKFGIPKIDFLKIDIEGQEFELLLDTPANELKKVHTIVLEYHEWFGQKSTGTQLVEYLENLDFSVKVHNPFYLRFLKMGFMSAINNRL